MSDPALRVFDHIESETSPNDRRSLLVLQEFAATGGPYDYLEIGSHLGGSLQPFVVDERCRSIVSIDPRPAAQPDSRLPEGELHHYEGNSTERMLGLLAAIPGADLSKLRTIERSTEAIDPASIATDPALCFIDGEHTHLAALRDALFCAAVAPRSVVAFHDSQLVWRGISAFMRVVGGYGHPLPDSVFVVDLGGRGRFDDQITHPEFWRAANAARCAAEAKAVRPAVGALVQRLRPAGR